MLAIRLFRTGKKNQPFFKIVVTDKRRSSTRGRFVEQVGFYNPLTKEKNLKAERIKYWISVGAKPSDTIHNLLISGKVVEGKKIPKHKKVVKEGEPPQAAATAEDKATATEQPVKAEAKAQEALEPIAEAKEAPQEQTEPEEKTE